MDENDSGGEERQTVKSAIEHILGESLDVKRRSILANADKLQEVATVISQCFAGDGRVLIFGNGGSAADAQHIAAELVGRFRVERKPLPAIALTTDTSILTAIGNDYGFDDIFSRQVLAHGDTGDIAIGISTSGNSPNVVRALSAAVGRGMTTIAMTGRGGDVVAFAEFVLTVDSDVTARIQETHITMGHIICELVEHAMFNR